MMCQKSTLIDGTLCSFPAPSYERLYDIIDSSPASAAGHAGPLAITHNPLYIAVRFTESHEDPHQPLNLRCWLHDTCRAKFTTLLSPQDLGCVPRFLTIEPNLTSPFHIPARSPCRRMRTPSSRRERSNACHIMLRGPQLQDTLCMFCPCARAFEPHVTSIATLYFPASLRFLYHALCLSA